MTDLFTATREHDLPPKWDGLAVIWEPWEPAGDIFICPAAPTGCTECGSTATPISSRGTVAVSHIVTRQRLADYLTNRSRLGPLAYRARILGTGRLFAYRCPDCHHDSVHDLNTRESWDLDCTDYGDDGSVAP